MGVAFGVVAADFSDVQFVTPAPPKRVVIAAAGKDTPYYRLAAQYQRYFAENGVTLKSGNVRLVRESETAHRPEIRRGYRIFARRIGATRMRRIAAMGRVAYEPVWGFYRGAETLDRLSQLQGQTHPGRPRRRRHASPRDELLAASGITMQTRRSCRCICRIISRPSRKDRRTPDLSCWRRTPRRCNGCSRCPGVQPDELCAGRRIFAALSVSVAARSQAGRCGFGKNIPPDDTALVATKTGLIVKESLHPAIISLLAEAVLVVHGAAAIHPYGEAKLSSRRGISDHRRSGISARR